MNERSKYNPLEDGKENTLRPCYGANYEAIQMLRLKYTGTSHEEKTEIIKEFKLDLEDDKDEIGVKEYYEQLCPLIFLEAADFNFAKINIEEVNRAYKDFFSFTESSTPLSSIELLSLLKSLPLQQIMTPQNQMNTPGS